MPLLFWPVPEMTGEICHDEMNSPVMMIFVKASDDVN